MKSTRQRVRKREFDGEFDITPMIDVVLLLLIFFIVTARMEPSIVAELPKSENGEAATGEDGVVINVRHNESGGSEVLRSDGSPFTTAGDSLMEEIAEYVRIGIEDESKGFVLIRGEPNVKTRDINIIREAASSVLEEDQQIRIAVQ